MYLHTKVKQIFCMLNEQLQIFKFERNMSNICYLISMAVGVYLIIIQYGGGN